MVACSGFWVSSLPNPRNQTWSFRFFLEWELNWIVQPTLLLKPEPQFTLLYTTPNSLPLGSQLILFLKIFLNYFLLNISSNSLPLGSQLIIFWKDILNEFLKFILSNLIGCNIHITQFFIPNDMCNLNQSWTSLSLKLVCKTFKSGLSIWRTLFKTMP